MQWEELGCGGKGWTRRALAPVTPVQTALLKELLVLYLWLRWAFGAGGLYRLRCSGVSLWSAELSACGAPASLLPPGPGSIVRGPRPCTTVAAHLRVY